MLFSTVICCETGYTGEIKDIKDFTFDNMKNYTVDINGAIQYQKDKTPLKYGSKLCYDLKTMVKKIQNTGDLILFQEGGINLVVKNTDNDSGNYTINNQSNINTKGAQFLSIKIPSDINIIIPENVIIYQKDVIFNIEGNNVEFNSTWKNK
ncbi:MAG: hypothetical protein IJ848_01510 [Alphaproteobacteria bacterium]|nr:hypothetical protein [Alphaproteobacteria bacterium]